jgi:hypothetical protein
LKGRGFSRAAKRMMVAISYADWMIRVSLKINDLQTKKLE